MKAIETVYLGMRYRSRLEARWAAYFDLMGFKFHYEMEGYDLGDAGWYLPDFFFPKVKMWAEVKPVEFSAEEGRKVDALAKFTGYPVLKLIGPPEKKSYDAVHYEVNNGIGGFFVCNYALSNYGGYYKNEDRFYASFPESEIELMDDIDHPVWHANQCRFENKSPKKPQWKSM